MDTRIVQLRSAGRLILYVSCLVERSSRTVCGETHLGCKHLFNIFLTMLHIFNPVLSEIKDWSQWKDRLVTPSLHLPSLTDLFSHPDSLTHQLADSRTPGDYVNDAGEYHWSPPTSHLHQQPKLREIVFLGDAAANLLLLHQHKLSFCPNSYNIFFRVHEDLIKIIQNI